MGMFDYIRCKYPLPVEGANELEFQTKDTGWGSMDNYEIREDGTLWHEVYEVEDKSEAGKWMTANPGKKVPEELSFAGCLARVNKQWLPVTDFVGELRFYTTITDLPPYGWLEFSAYFVAGKLNQLRLLEHRKPGEERKEG